MRYSGKIRGRPPPLPTGGRASSGGTRHQVDALADYRFSPPFSQRYRLLVEGKSLKGAVGLATVRNALGVVRDVSEVWDVRSEPRFHYQYAIFCDTRFTAPAQDYAFVQDIFLLPLGELPCEFEFLRPVVDTARAIGAALIGSALPSQIPARVTCECSSWSLASLEGLRCCRLSLLADLLKNQRPRRFD